ncbi:MAG: hypothetical protein PHO57_10880 [Acidithiobacillus sp.]|nr:hypothetical protein [Acidithiobacillus sp.]
MKQKKLHAFFEGVATVLQLYPTQNQPMRSRFYQEPASSAEAISSDWIRVGDSLRLANYSDS